MRWHREVAREECARRHHHEWPPRRAAREARRVRDIRSSEVGKHPRRWRRSSRRSRRETRGVHLSRGVQTRRRGTRRSYARRRLVDRRHGRRPKRWSALESVGVPTSRRREVRGRTGTVIVEASEKGRRRSARRKHQRIFRAPGRVVGRRRHAARIQQSLEDAEP